MVKSKLTVWQFICLAATIIISSEVSQAGSSRFYQTVLEEADGQSREFFSNLIENIDSPEQCYNLLKRRLLDGDFDNVNLALEMQDQDGEQIFTGYSFALLKAQCAGEMFKLYSQRANPSGWPSEEQGVELRRLAQNATSAYEEAFQLAPTRFDKACIYTYWHELHTLSRFEADSQLLRSGSPLEYQSESIDERLSMQVTQLRSAATAALDEVTAQVNRNVFLDVLAEEYEKVGRIGVPDEVFSVLIDDVSLFLQEAIHSEVLADPQGKRLTIQYHLWYALTGHWPDEIDNEYIDKQVETVNQLIHEGFSDILPEYEDAASTAFLDHVEIIRGNRFIPYLNQPIWPYEWSEARNSSSNSIEVDILERIDSSVERLIGDINRVVSRVFPGRNRTIQETEQDIQERATSSMRSLAAWLVSDMSENQRLQHDQQIPDMIITGSGGTTHDNSGIWVYRTSQVNPIPPYPWKKQITPIDSTTAGTRDIARIVLKAIAEGDKATLGTLIVESRDFSINNIDELLDSLNKLNTNLPLDIGDINDIFIESQWSWSVVRVSLPTREAGRNLFLIFHWKNREYWLAWAGILDPIEGYTMANVLRAVKPGLELPPIPETFETTSKADIAFLEDIAQVEFLESLPAGHSWQVKLAIIPADQVIAGLSDVNETSMLKMLYCRAEWINAQRPPKSVLFSRYIANHIGPVLWTISNDGFREENLETFSHTALPVSIKGDGCDYAAVLPAGTGDIYVQVYSAYIGVELARKQISQTEVPLFVWGQFMEPRRDVPFGVMADYEAANPDFACFRPIEKTDLSINLSLNDGFFQLKTDERILPVRGSRLLARWWINGEPVIAKAAVDFNFPENVETEGLAKLIRLPAKLPTALQAKKGDNIELQVMLSSGSITPTLLDNEDEPNNFIFKENNLPMIPLVSNRISFMADSEMLALPGSVSATALSFNNLVEAIADRDIKKVRRLVAACPDLINFRDSNGSTAIDYVYLDRPEPYRILGFSFGGKVTKEYWEDMAEIAGILLDYGADINAETRMQRTPLQNLIYTEERYARSGHEIPIELGQVLLDRGANVEVITNSDGTIIQKTIDIIQSERSERIVPIAEMLLDYGADVFAQQDPFAREPAFDMIDSLGRLGYLNLATLIFNSGEKQREIIEEKVNLGIEEFLSEIRYAGEKELLSLNDELPRQRGIEWLQLGRQFQSEFGPDLQGIGKIDELSLKGNWAEAILPTGRQGDKANMRITLMKYPAGDYHVIEATMTNLTEAGRSINNAEMTYRGLMNAVYSAFGRLDMCNISGSMGTGYPDRFDKLSISSKRGRLIIQGLDLPSWIYFHVELMPSVVCYWDDVWDLSMANTIKFETDDRQLLMDGGTVRVKNANGTVEFSISDDKVRFKRGATELVKSEFILDLRTLDVEYD